MLVANDQAQNLTSNIDLTQHVKSTGPVTSARINELKQVLENQSSQAVLKRRSKNFRVSLQNRKRQWRQ